MPAAPDEELVGRGSELVAERPAPPHTDEEVPPRGNGKGANRAKRLTEELRELVVNSSMSPAGKIASPRTVSPTA